MSPSRKNGRAWFKLGEPHASHTKPSSEKQRVAGFFLRFIESSRPLRLVELDGKPRLAAAAASSVVGGCPRSALPAWFKANASLDRPVGLQVLICALEALDQLVLLDVQPPDDPTSNIGCVVARQFCDNVTCLLFHVCLCG